MLGIALKPHFVPKFKPDEEVGRKGVLFKGRIKPRLSSKWLDRKDNQELCQTGNNLNNCMILLFLLFLQRCFFDRTLP